MNEFIWAQLLQNKLNYIDGFIEVKFVVHSTHNDIVSYEMRSKVAPTVAFGKIKLKAEYVDEAVERSLKRTFEILQQKTGNYYRNKQKA